VRTVVIPHPVVEGAEAQPSARASEAGRRTIGFLGRIHPTKNVDLLLRVLAHQPSSVRLIIAGSGADGLMAELTGLAAAEGVEDRVEWRGFVDAEGRARFFEDVDLLVVPSTYECFGMSGAEALAAGVPVIASERTGIAEIIRASGGGAVCAPEEAAVGAALGAAWDPGALDRWSREAAAAATASLSYAAYGSSIDEAYRLLVSPGSRS
jgi:glycosyltransferase involved in cell wall biosynthesis